MASSRSNHHLDKSAVLLLVLDLANPAGAGTELPKIRQLGTMGSGVLV